MAFTYPELPAREEIERYECVSATYSKANDYSPNDVVVVKELIHCKDGRIIPNLRLIHNYQRDFYVTLDKYRTHKDKRPWAPHSHLRKFTCAQHELHNKVARALGNPAARGGLRQLARSAYLYGADINTPVLIKRGYRDKYGGTPTPSSVAVYDIETNMNSEEKEIIIASITLKNKARQNILSNWIAESAIPEADKEPERFKQLVREKTEELLGAKGLKILAKRGIDAFDPNSLEINILDLPAHLVQASFEAAHEWQPDYVTIFNMAFDIPKSEEALLNAGYNPSDVFCDPRIPRKFRNFKWRQGAAHKVKKDGGKDTKVPINPIDQWHTVDVQASFQICDSMLLYKRIRTASANDPEYNLDYLLRKHKLAAKLKFSQADGYVKGEWHAFMQKYYPVEYCVYNLYDDIGVEMLDEVTKDISMCLPALLKCSEYRNYDSQPKMIADDLHFFLLNRGLVAGTTSDEMLTEVDQASPGLGNWIITLPAYMGPDSDTDLIRDMFGHRTLLHTHVSDIDVVSTYPKLQDMLNIDKFTTQTELSSVDGMEEDQWRWIGIDLTGGHVNGTMIAQQLLGLPSSNDLLAWYDEDHKDVA